MTEANRNIVFTFPDSETLGSFVARVAELYPIRAYLSGLLVSLRPWDPGMAQGVVRIAQETVDYFGRAVTIEVLATGVRHLAEPGARVPEGLVEAEDLAVRGEELN